MDPPDHFGIPFDVDAHIDVAAIEQHAEKLVEKNKWSADKLQTLVDGAIDAARDYHRVRLYELTLGDQTTARPILKKLVSQAEAVLKAIGKIDESIRELSARAPNTYSLFQPILEGGSESRSKAEAVASVISLINSGEISESEADSQILAIFEGTSESTRNTPTNTNHSLELLRNQAHENLKAISHIVDLLDRKLKRRGRAPISRLKDRALIYGLAGIYVQMTGKQPSAREAPEGGTGARGPFVRFFEGWLDVIDPGRVLRKPSASTFKTMIKDWKKVYT